MYDDGIVFQSNDLIGRDYDSLLTSDKTEVNNAADPTKTALQKVGVSPFAVQAQRSCNLEPNNARIHRIQWGASAEQPDAARTILKKTIMIVRSPIDGSIHTYTYNDAIAIGRSVGKNLNTSDGSGTTACGAGTLNYIPSSSGLNSDTKSIFILKEITAGVDGFTKDSEPVKICVGSPDLFAYSGNRRMISLAPNGRNSSAVTLEDMDTGGALCQ